MDEVVGGRCILVGGVGVGGMWICVGVCGAGSGSVLSGGRRVLRRNVSLDVVDGEWGVEDGERHGHLEITFYIGQHLGAQ